MKKIFSGLIFLLLYSICSAVKLPDDFYGIWEGVDRFVFFENNDENDEIVIVLKEFYGWYLDRAAEPDFYSELNQRERNTGTAKNPEHVHVSMIPTEMDCYELELSYSKYEKNQIPVVIVDDKMYLNFYVKDKMNPDFWRGFVSSEGLKVSPQSVTENISCLYFVNDYIFDIRYWKSDMDYTDEKAFFTYDGKEYYVDKHIKSAGNLYACTNGRSRKIRNLTRPVGVLNNSLQFYNDKSIMIIDDKPYLKKIADKNTFQDLMQIVKNQNDKRKPVNNPFFPIIDLDVHEKLLVYLEKENYTLKDIPIRQHDFGSDFVQVE